MELFRNDRPIISPLSLGIGIGTLLLVALITSETLLGRWSVLAAEGQSAFARGSLGVLRDLRISIVHCLVMGYLPAALLQALHNGRQTVLRLQDALDCTPEECRRLAQSIRLPASGLVVTGLAGFGLALLSPYLIPPVPDNVWQPSTWSAEVAWHRVLSPVAIVLQSWLAFAIVLVSLRTSRVAESLSSIDLLNLEPLAPFGRLGLQNALLVVGNASVWSLMLLESGVGTIMAVMGGLTLVVCVFAVVAPVRGVSRRVRLAKKRELDWTNAALRDRREAVRGGAQAEDGATIADLVAWRTLVDSVSDWPFTMSTYTRILIYAVIPVLSWGLGVVAEEIVGRLLF